MEGGGDTAEENCLEVGAMGVREMGIPNKGEARSSREAKQTVMLRGPETSRTHTLGDNGPLTTQHGRGNE